MLLAENIRCSLTGVCSQKFDGPIKGVNLSEKGTG